MIDLWPEDIGQDKPKAPVSILQEQAALLGQKTQNVVEASVRPRDTGSPNRFSYAFNIVAVGLGSYTYRLFSIQHDVNLYPVTFFLDQDIAIEIISQQSDGPIERSLSVESEEALVGLLGEILKSKKTRRIIDALLSQADYLEEIPS